MPAITAEPTKSSIIAWHRAIGASSLVVYGPFFVLAVYAVLWESSSYVQTTAWMLLPCAPGLLPVEGGRQLLGLPRPSDAVTFLIAFIFTVGAIGGLAFLRRRGRWLGIAGLVVASTVCSLSAVGLLGMLRS